MAKNKTLFDFFISPKNKAATPSTEKRKRESGSPITPKSEPVKKSNGSANKRAFIEDCTSPEANNENKRNVSTSKQKRRRLIIASESDDSGDEYKPEKKDECDEYFSDIDLPSDVDFEEEEVKPKKPRKSNGSANKSTSKVNRKSTKGPNLNSSKLSTTSENITDVSISETTEEKEWTHLSLEWIKDDKIRDKECRPKSHPNYDPKTLYVPDGFKKNCTPAMRQWWEMKENHFDTVLFFKVGKFYELYHMDAVIGVSELGLTFMRGEFAHSGFPEIAYARFSDRLVQKGYKVARVEQTETPLMMEERCKRQSFKATKFDKVVAREICQITSKGTKIFNCQDGEPMAANSNFLLAVTEKVSNEDSLESSEYGICFIDASVGKFYIGQFSDDRHCSRIRTLTAHYPPTEILYERDVISKRTLQMFNSNLQQVKHTPMSTSSKFWDTTQTLKFIIEKKYFNSSDPESAISWPKVIENMMDENDRLFETPKKEYELAMRAFSAVVWYFKECLIEDQILTMKLFEPYYPLDDVAAIKEKSYFGQYMVLDGVTLSNLEVIESSTGDADGTLIDTIDMCSTNFGKRLLRQWLCVPLCNPKSIENRLDAVEDLDNISHIIEDLTPLFRKLPDLERLLSKIHAQGLSRPKDHPDTRAIFYEEDTYSKRKINDFLSTLDGFKSCKDIIKQLTPFVSEFKSSVLSQSVKLVEDGGCFPDMRETLEYFDTAFDHEDAKKTGRIIPCKGVDLAYDSSVEEIKDVNIQFDEYLDKQKKKFQCKVTYFGAQKNRYQLEVPEHAARDAGNKYELQSQRKGFKRFYTSEIKEMLGTLTAAEDRRDAALLDIMRRIFEKFDQNCEMWKTAVQCISVLDVFISLMKYKKSSTVPMCRPQVVPLKDNEKPYLKIVEGRHPALLKSFSGDNYIPNSVYLGTKQESKEDNINNGGTVVLVTGPNMGGKSTLMRQTGLIVILAQLGSYVPAEKCCFSPVDRIFTRLGASDKINAGESTFFVEVSEMSCILQHATADSLVLVDELGRGTSTFDGTAIACAVVNELATRIDCRTLFSTHYHSLVEDFVNYPHVGLGHMACMVEDDDNHPALENITFLYKFMDGICPKSYGFNVAHLAGIPEEIVQRGYQKAKELEKLHKSS